MALQERVRDKLRSEGVKLWEPPYTVRGESPGIPAAVAALATSYAVRLGEAGEAVQDVLEDLRHHALTKLRAKSRVSRVSILCKISGSAPSAIRGTEIPAAFDVADSGLRLRLSLCERLGVARMKIVADGRVLVDEASLSEQGWKCDQERDNKPLKVLLLCFGVAAPADAEASASASLAVEPSLAKVAAEMPCPVQTIRQAAEKLTREGFGGFELSDANTGRLVPIPPAARQALITAIALHARGRELLGTGSGPAAAIEFLAEADVCFERVRAAGAGQLLEQLANFGQLQLDLCWAYALLGDSDHLPDAEQRLRMAERMIKRQVDVNFLTLAEVQADQGKTLPPEVLPSVRLWLLRGVARRLRGDTAGARTDLTRAALFLQSLKVDPSAVDILLTFGASRQQAVAALRRCEGSADAAATQLLAAAERRRHAQAWNEERGQLGQTVEGSFVKPELVKQLTGMGFDKRHVIKALKKANNDLAAALDEVQSLVEAEAEGRPVDEEALARLVSMGYDQSKAEAALRKVGASGIEAAIPMLDQMGSTKEAEPPREAEQAPAPQEAAEAEARKAAEQEEAKQRERRAEAKKAAKQAEAKQRKQQALDEAREVVKRELGRCLRRTDMEDDFAGAELEEEEALVQQHLSGLL